MAALYNTSEWDLSSDSFVGDRGGAAGLVQVHEEELEKGSTGRSFDEFGRRLGGGGPGGGAGGMGRGGKVDGGGRSQRSLEVIPEDGSASASSVSVSTIDSSRSSGSSSRTSGSGRGNGSTTVS